MAKILLFILLLTAVYGTLGGKEKKEFFDCMVDCMSDPQNPNTCEKNVAERCMDILRNNQCNRECKDPKQQRCSDCVNTKGPIFCGTCNAAIRGCCEQCVASNGLKPAEGKGMGGNPRAGGNFEIQI